MTLLSARLYERGPDHRYLSVFYLTTIGAFSAGAVGAIEKTSQVFQPDDGF